MELLHTFAERFYHRQFINRKVVNHEILTRLEDFLAGYFSGRALAKPGPPSVVHIAEALNISPGYYRYA